MASREVYTRIVEPNGSSTIDVGPFDLWWAALAAADETILGSPLAPAWLGLFADHLSHTETTELRWRGDLADSAEMRRAYSALYGRFFARAFLMSRLGLQDFVPLDSERTELADGATVQRIRSGDMPDWIAWDPLSRSYVLAEAKGRLTGTEKTFLSSTPSCIAAGKAQFARVEVRDARYKRIATRDWVAATLWATDRRARRPVVLLWDPEGEGDQLAVDEVPLHAASIRRHRLDRILTGMGHSGGMGSRTTAERAVRLAMEAPQSTPTFQPSERERLLQPDIGDAVIVARRSDDEPAREPHEGEYLAAVVTERGFRPIVDEADFNAARALQQQAREGGVPAMVYGISLNAQVVNPEAKPDAWLAPGGIVSPDGAALFDIRELELARARDSQA